jgi:phage gp46-like protein
MSDPTLTLQENGGDLTLEGGDLLVGNGLESAAVCSLWGGNLDDNSLPGDDPKQYWANLVVPDQSSKLRSETQRLLTSIPATSGNLLRLQDAIARDLDWMTENLVEKMFIEVSLVGVKRVSTVIDFLMKDGDTPQLKFTREWTGQE